MEQRGKTQKPVPPCDTMKRERFGVFQVDNLSSREERDYLSSADEVKRNPSYVSVRRHHRKCQAFFACTQHLQLLAKGPLNEAEG